MRLESKLFILFAGLALVTMLWIGQKQCTERTVLKKVSGILYPEDTVKYWKDMYGQEHVKALQADMNLEEFMALYPDSLSRVSKLLGVKQKQIEELQQIIAESDNHFTAPVKIDSNGVQRFDFHSDFTRFSAEILNGKAIVFDTTIVPIETVSYWQRKHVFLGIRYGEVLQYLDVKSDNPNVRLTTAQSIRIKVKKPGRIGIGPYVGIDVMGRASIGIGVNYSLIRF
jgi:hypothetical protein